MFQFKSIEHYQKQLASNEIDCVSIVQHYLKQIEANKTLNAFVEIYEEESLQKARKLDETRKSGEAIGSLHGVVIAIKDVICYKDHNVTAASHILQGFASLYSSTAVKKLINADAIIIGTCNCDEFAIGSTNENSYYGKVLNALDVTKVPGGSSGGSAVAVQAGLCMVGLGSDTGGSVRQPADFCGVIGLKPTYGRISRHGLIAYASSFDQIGIFANSVDDVSVVLETISGKDEYDGTVSFKPVENYSNYKAGTKKPSIAYFKNALEHHSLDIEIRDNIYSLIDRLKSDGYTAEPLHFKLLDYIVPTYYVLTTAEASSNLARYDGVRYGSINDHAETDLTKYYTSNRSSGFGKEVKRRIMLGTFVLSAGYYDAYFTKAQRVRQILADETSAIFKQFDALILPTVPSTAFDIDNMAKDPIKTYLADIYTVFANLAGIPGISIPLFKHTNGMPFGLQIMSNKYNEVTLLQLSDQLLSSYRLTEKE